MNLASGAIVILAYPEEFVQMIPGWFRKPMKWAGMVNNERIAAGHSAMALIEKKTGNIHYADFGRYVAKIGDGRTRMAHTDPDVIFDYKVQFDSEGQIIDQESLFQLFYDSPEKTHGGEVMYISINHNVDFDSCYNFISTMNKKGSIIYNPFGEGNSNCSRFVFEALISGIIDTETKKRLKRKSPITSSPLGNVFYGTTEESYKYTHSKIEIVTDKSLINIIKHLLRKPIEGAGSIEKKIASPWSQNDHVNFLGGIGDQAYIKLDSVKETSIGVSKYGADKQLTFSKNYQRNPVFDPNKPFEFIHDCNAAWITVSQEGKSIRMDAV